MTNPRKIVLDPEVQRAPGRPSEYRPDYCDQLIAHCKAGNSFESFGAIAGVCEKTLYTWQNKHPEFLQARKVALSYLRKFYEDLGKLMATGALRRLKSETVVLDAEGRPVLDPATGQVLMNREYEPAHGAQAVYIFMTKNMLGWRDKRELALFPGDEQPAQQRRRADDLTPEERMKEIADMTAALAEIEGATSEPGSTGQSGTG